MQHDIRVLASSTDSHATRVLSCTSIAPTRVSSLVSILLSLWLISSSAVTVAAAEPEPSSAVTVAAAEPEPSAAEPEASSSCAMIVVSCASIAPTRVSSVVSIAPTRLFSVPSMPSSF